MNDVHPRFRWKRATLHALITIALVFTAGLVLLFTTHPVDDDKAADGVGQFTVFAAVAAFGISYLAQTGRRAAAWWTAIGLFVGTIGITAALVASSHHAAEPLSAADRAPLVDVVVNGQHRLRHPTFGFSILRPPASYADAPQMAAMMDAKHDPATVAYAYAETPSQSALIIGVMTSAGESRADFTSFIAGIKRGFERSTAAVRGAEPVQYLRDEITGDDAHLEAHVHVVGVGTHMQTNAYVIHPPGRPTTVVTLMVMATDPATLADVLTSFRP